MSNLDTHLGDFYAPIPNFERVFGIPLCDCKFADIGNSKVGYHHAHQENDICTRCGHYVFYGSEKDVTDVSDSNIIRYSDDKVEAVREAYVASGNASAVAREFGISRHTVSSWKKQFNWRKK